MFRRQPEAEFTILKRTPTGTITENNQIVTTGDETRPPQAFNKLKEKITKIRPLSYLPTSSSRSSSPVPSNHLYHHKKSFSTSSVNSNHNTASNNLLEPSQEILDILAMVDPTNEKLTGVSRLSQYFTSTDTQQPSDTNHDFQFPSTTNSNDSSGHRFHQLQQNRQTQSDSHIFSPQSRDINNIPTQFPLDSSAAYPLPPSSLSKSPPLNIPSDQEPRKSVLASSIMSSFGQPPALQQQQQQQQRQQQRQQPLPQTNNANVLNHNTPFENPSSSTTDSRKPVNDNYNGNQIQINLNENAIDDEEEYDSDDSFTVGDERRLSVLSSDMSPEERRQMIFSHGTTNNSVLSPLSPTFSTHSFQPSLNQSPSQFDYNENSANSYRRQSADHEADLLERISSYESQVVPLSVSKNNSRANSRNHSRASSFSKPTSEANFNLHDVEAAVDSLLSENQRLPKLSQYPQYSQTQPQPQSQPQPQAAPTLILPSDHRHSFYSDDLIRQYDRELDQQRNQRPVIPSLEISSVDDETSYGDPYADLKEDYSYNPGTYNPHPLPKDDYNNTKFSVPGQPQHDRQSFDQQFAVPIEPQESFVKQHRPQKSIEEQFVESQGVYKPIFSPQSESFSEQRTPQYSNSPSYQPISSYQPQPLINVTPEQKLYQQPHSQRSSFEFQRPQSKVQETPRPVSPHRPTAREVEEPAPSQKLSLTRTQAELNQWEKEAETLALHIPSETSLAASSPTTHKRISRFNIFGNRHRSHSDADSINSPTSNEPRSPVPPSPALSTSSFGQSGNSYFNKQPDEVARNMAVTFSKSTDEQVQHAIDLHEAGKLEESAELFETLGDPNGINHPLAQVLLGLSYRHGWGVPVNEEMAFKYLRIAASNSALVDKIAATGQATNIKASASNKSRKGIAKGELVLSIYELGNCFRYGWGTEKDPESALKYYETAARLGDVDAMSDAAWCYMNGFGIKKKNKYMAAKYYRMAEKAGKVEVGNSWVWKEKYDDDKQKK